MAKKKPIRRRDAITPESLLRVAIYTRRSTDDEHQPYSIEAQTHRLEAYVASQPGWQISASYTDDASGATLDRPGLRDALTAARDRRFDLLLVYRLDRFSRRIADLANLMDELDAAGVHFRSATEPFDTSSAAGRLFVQMLGAFAEFEREVIIDRVISGMERKAAKGEWTYGPRPYGYTVDPTTQRLLPHLDEAPVVREIFELYARVGLGTRAIAERLNTQGRRTKNGKPFSGHTVIRMLVNRLYLGEVGFREVVVPDAHEALVDEDLFLRCQAVLSKRTDPHSSRAAANSDYQLTGLITCPECGHGYVGTSATGKLRRYRYYTCFSRARYGTAGCTASRIDADLLEQAVNRALLDLLADTDLIIDVVEAEWAVRAQDTAKQREELAGISGQIAAAETAVDRYLAAFETGALDERTCGHRIRDLHIKIDQLTVRRDELTALVQYDQARVRPEDIAQTRAELAHVLEHGENGAKKAIIEAHVAEIKIDGRDLIPTFMVPYEFRTGGQVVGRAGLEPATEGL
ncbi:recombinase family protein [Hamadaea tsunoensis]|uniref:recombinase family protein n=1 Tax=Hamadaea tsunoensis TaxID=53368 RepID=UPI000A023707|nr:recombinase family protein [Hamadaea tsunoensis]